MGSLRGSFPAALGTESARCRSRTSLGNVPEPSSDRGLMEMEQCSWWLNSSLVAGESAASCEDLQGVLALDHTPGIWQTDPKGCDMSEVCLKLSAMGEG